MKNPATAKTPLRVARVIARLNVGGPARHAIWLTSSLNDAGFPSILITGMVPRHEETMTGFAEANGVRPIVIRQMRRDLSPLDLITTMRLVAHFWRFDPDVIHTHTAKAGAVGRMAGVVYRFLCRALRRRVPALVHTYHGHIFHSYYGRTLTAFFLAIERILSRVTDRIVVLSEQQRAEIQERFRIGRPERFRVVPLGLDFAAISTTPELRARQRTRLNVAPDEKVIAIVGRLAPVKNHSLFLRAALRVLRSPRPSSRFVIYGEGSERPRIEALAGQLSLGDSLIFAGTCDAAALYSSADLVVLSSLNEGTPLTLIEAMGNGIPTVSTAVGGVVDLLGPVLETVVSPDGSRYEIRERGLSAASGDETGLAAAILRVLDDADLVAQCTLRAREYARASHSRERLVADIIALYSEIRGERGSTGDVPVPVR